MRLWAQSYSAGGRGCSHGGADGQGGLLGALATAAVAQASTDTGALSADASPTVQPAGGAYGAAPLADVRRERAIEASRKRLRDDAAELAEQLHLRRSRRFVPPKLYFVTGPSGSGKSQFVFSLFNEFGVFVPYDPVRKMFGPVPV